MTCQKLQAVLYSNKIDELDPSERDMVKAHLAQCGACRDVFEEISHADRTLAKIKTAAPRISDEHALAASILSSLPQHEEEPLLNRFTELFRLTTVRWACGSIILLFGMLFLWMEYQDMKEVVNLEQRLGNPIHSSQADVGIPIDQIFKGFYDYYRLWSGRTSYIEISHKLVLMKKKDLLALMNRYQELDNTAQEQLITWKDIYLNENPMEFQFSRHQQEMRTLQKEIEQLKNRLERLKQMEER